MYHICIKLHLCEDVLLLNSWKYYRNDWKKIVPVISQYQLLIEMNFFGKCDVFLRQGLSLHFSHEMICVLHMMWLFACFPLALPKMSGDRVCEFKRTLWWGKRLFVAFSVVRTPCSVSVQTIPVQAVAKSILIACWFMTFPPVLVDTLQYPGIEHNYVNQVVENSKLPFMESHLSDNLPVFLLRK